LSTSTDATSRDPIPIDTTRPRRRAGTRASTAPLVLAVDAEAAAHVVQCNKVGLAREVPVHACGWLQHPPQALGTLRERAGEDVPHCGCAVQNVDLHDTDGKGSSGWNLKSDDIPELCPRAPPGDRGDIPTIGPLPGGNPDLVAITALEDAVSGPTQSPPGSAFPSPARAPRAPDLACSPTPRLRRTRSVLVDGVRTAASGWPTGCGHAYRPAWQSGPRLDHGG
jgi:hypothetical protein